MHNIISSKVITYFYRNVLVKICYKFLLVFFDRRISQGICINNFFLVYSKVGCGLYDYKSLQWKGRGRPTLGIRNVSNTSYGIFIVLLMYETYLLKLRVFTVSLLVLPFHIKCQGQEKSCKVCPTLSNMNTTTRGA